MNSPNPDSPKTKKFTPFSAILVTIGAFFGSQLLAGLIIGAYIELSGKSVDDATRIFDDSTFGRFIFFLIIQSITLGLIFWFMKKRKISLAEIGLGRWPRLSDLGNAVVWFVVYFILAAVVLYLVGMIAPGINLDQEQQIGFKSAVGTPSLFLVFITLVILPPLVEEIMIRGFLYSGLRTKLPQITSALAASFIFAIAHLQLGMGAPPLYVAAIDTFVLSLILISLRERTGSLWAGMIVHAMKNGLAFLALFVFST